MMLTNFQLQAVGDIRAKGNQKGKAVSALPFAAGCHAECLGWGIGGAKLKLKNNFPKKNNFFLDSYSHQMYFILN